MSDLPLLVTMTRLHAEVYVMRQVVTALALSHPSELRAAIGSTIRRCADRYAPPAGLPAEMHEGARELADEIALGWLELIAD